MILRVNFQDRCLLRLIVEMFCFVLFTLLLFNTLKLPCSCQECFFKSYFIFNSTLALSSFPFFPSLPSFLLPPSLPSSTLPPPSFLFFFLFSVLVGDLTSLVQCITDLFWCFSGRSFGCYFGICFAKLLKQSLFLIHPLVNYWPFKPTWP